MNCVWSVTLRDLAAGLRLAFANDPLRAEKAIGHMYGNAFKRREAIYDTPGGQKW